jgi:hypothetical protein
MEEKAKYITNKEVTLFNDLDKAHKKLKEIANWYYLSDYKRNAADEKNQILYTQLTNNIYRELSNLLFNSRNWRLYENFKEVVTNDLKLKDLSALEELLQEIKTRKEVQILKEEYNLSFNQAIELCLNDNNFIVGEDFQKGCYAKNFNGTVVMMEINKNGFHEMICNLMITDRILKQKFKTLVVVNKKTLGMEN